MSDKTPPISPRSMASLSPSPQPIPSPITITQHPYLDFLGIPFAWKGRTAVGCDCLGFASMVSQKVSGKAFRLTDELIEDYYARHHHAPKRDTEVLGLAHKLLDSRTGRLRHSDLVILRATGEDCLTTYLEHGRERYLAAMFRSGSRVIEFDRVFSSTIVGTFDVSRLLNS